MKPKYYGNKDGKKRFSCVYVRLSSFVVVKNDCQEGKEATILKASTKIQLLLVNSKFEGYNVPLSSFVFCRGLYSTGCDNSLPRPSSFSIGSYVLLCRSRKTI